MIHPKEIAGVPYRDLMEAFEGLDSDDQAALMSDLYTRAWGHACDLFLREHNLVQEEEEDE